MHTVAMSSFWRELVIQLNKYIKGYEEEEKKSNNPEGSLKKIKICQKPMEVLSYSLSKILWREKSLTPLSQYCLQLLQWKF